MTYSPWFSQKSLHSQARMRLFCFPFAGGGTAIFKGWAEDFPAHIDVVPVHLPGRESRFAEPAPTRLDELVDRLVEGLGPALDRPFAFFGYSMGALISYALTVRLMTMRLPLPVRVLVAAHAAPQCERLPPLLHALPHDAFWARLARYEATPQAVLENAELRQLMEPTLRADFTIVETAVPLATTSLACPISAFGGTGDDTVTRSRLEAWRDVTAAAFDISWFEGSHFFLFDHAPALRRAIAARLGEY